MKVKSFFILMLVVMYLLACGKKNNEEKSQTNVQSMQQTHIGEIEAKQDTTKQAMSEQQSRPKLEVTKTEDGKYTIQVSSWRTRAAAEKDAQRFRNAGFDVYIQKAYLPNRGGTWYRVRVGRFMTLEEGRQFAQQLQEMLESGYWLDVYRAEK